MSLPAKATAQLQPPTAKVHELHHPMTQRVVRKRPLSGEVFGALINLSGRRRFTSQRIVLFALLAQAGREGALESGREALRLFSEAHAGLVEGGNDLPGVFSDALHAAYFGPLQGDATIRDFIDLAQRALDAIESGARMAPARVDELVDGATPLLLVLNQLTQVYEDESKVHAQRARKQLLSVMSDIETIAKQARMVSFNAQIVAARAGDAGREFSVVAGELTGITSRIDELVKVALNGSTT